MASDALAPEAVTFIGTATTVIRHGPFTLLTDPNFLHKGQRAYLGYGLSSKRLTDPACDIADLPPLDAVVLSHLHGDHFDRVAKKQLPRDVPVVTTPGGARRLARYGFRTQALETWQAHELMRDGWRLRVISAPGRHGPGPVSRLLPDVMGSVLEFTDPSGSVDLRVYITGDTLYGPYLDAVRERHPDLDLALVHLGGTRILGILLTMDATQGADLVELTQPRLAVPIHLDDYGVFRSPPQDFAREMHRRGLDDRVAWVPRGGTLELARVTRRR